MKTTNNHEYLRIAAKNKQYLKSYQLKYGGSFLSAEFTHSPAPELFRARPGLWKTLQTAKILRSK